MYIFSTLYNFGGYLKNGISSFFYGNNHELKKPLTENLKYEIETYQTRKFRELNKYKLQRLMDEIKFYPIIKNYKYYKSLTFGLNSNYRPNEYFYNL